MFRGYYYDEETGFYYLQSRYYDPAICRFINADGQLNSGLLGTNLFAYCENNTVNRNDPDGFYSFLCREEECVPKDNPKKGTRKTEITFNDTSITIVLGNDLAMAAFDGANLISYFIASKAVFKGVKTAIKIVENVSDVKAFFNALKTLDLLGAEGCSTATTTSSLIELHSMYENNGYVIVEFYIPQSATEFGELLLNGLWRTVNDG